MPRQVFRPSYHLCGCYYQVDSTLNYLPQVKLQSCTTILRTTSETTLEQTFSSNSKDAIKECDYTFPLYGGVSIVSFDCHIGNRTLSGIVMEQRKAKAVYDEAVARGETAGLLEQLPQASDVFTTQLGNIEAGGQIMVKITYVGELKHDAEVDGIRWTLPTSIAPRYGSGSHPAAGESSAQAEGGISIIVDVDVGQSSFIKGLQSPSHPIAVTLGSNSTLTNDAPVTHKASATLALGSAQLDDDFVLMILNKDNGAPTALLETHPDLPNHRALMVDLVPKFSLPPARPEIIFVADRSGSMVRHIPTLIAALQVFLKSLPLGVKFNICSFGSIHTFLWPRSRAYSKETLKEAVAHVQSFGADYSGTETYAAIQAAIERRFGDIDCEVLLLTDGDIWQQNELFEYLNRTVGNSIRVFALGIGGGVSSALIESVARAGKGFAQMVGHGEKLDKKLIRMLKGALSPHVSDYTMEIRYEQSADEEDNMSWEVVETVTDSLRVMTTEEKPQQTQKTQKTISLFDPSTESDENTTITASGEEQDPYQDLPEVEVPKLLQAPQEIPPLFSFSRTTVYILMSPATVQRNPKYVVLRGTTPLGPLELEIEVQKSASTSKKIHQLAARKAMQELEEGRGWLLGAKFEDGTLLKTRHASFFDEMVQREAIRLGVQFQVGGKWCSFVAVSEHEGELGNAEAKKAQRSDIPSELHVPAYHRSMKRARPEARARFSSGPKSKRSTVMHFAGVSGPAEAEDESDEDMVFGYSINENNACGTTSSFSGMPVLSPPPSLTQSAPPPGGGGQIIQRQCAQESIASRRPPPSSHMPASSYSYQLWGSPARPISTSGHSINEKNACRTPNSFSGMPALSPPPSLTRSAPPPGGGGLTSSRSSGRGAPQRQWAKESIASRRPHPTSHMSASSCSYQLCSSPARPMSPNEKVHAIINLQDFEGRWEASNELFDIMGWNHGMDKSRKVQETTVLVVVFLEQKMAGEKDIWELVVEKARAWLQSRKISVEKMEANARDVVKGECT